MKLRGRVFNREQQQLDDEVIDLTDRLAPYAGSALRVRPQTSDVEQVAPAPSFLELRPSWLRPFPAAGTLQDEPAGASAYSESILAEAETVDALVAPPVVEESPEPPGSVAASAAPVPEEFESPDAMLAELVRDEAEAVESVTSPVMAETGSRTAARKQARNEPCACGSGRKYKRCCGERP